MEREQSNRPIERQDLIALDLRRVRMAHMSIKATNPRRYIRELQAAARNHSEIDVSGEAE